MLEKSHKCFTYVNLYLYSYFLILLNLFFDAQCSWDQTALLTELIPDCDMT